MATATHTAPIFIDEINSTFYVTGRPDGFATIQEAVDYVRVHNGGTGIVVIVQGVDVADSIPAVTGGSINTWIWDNRAGNTQQWGWDGTKYVSAPFDQNAGYIARGMPGNIAAALLMGFDPTGASGKGRGDIIASAVAGQATPAIQLVSRPQNGDPTHTWFRGDRDPGYYRVQMPQALFLNNNAASDNLNLWVGQPYDLNISKGMWVWAKPSENAIDFQGLTVGGQFDQTIRLNPLGGDVWLTPDGITHVGELGITGDLTLIGGLNMEGDTHQSGDLHLAGNATMGRLTCIEIAGTDIGGNPAPVTIVGDEHVTGNLQVDGGAFFAEVNITGDIHQTGDFSLAGNATMGRLTCIEIAGSTITGTPGPLSILTDLNATADLDVAGDLTVTGIVDIAGTLQATSAAFDECLVEGSPVRTFANTPDGGGGGGGMEWPGAGIGVSTGTAWGTSIDPVTLAYRNQNNTFTGQMVIQSNDASKQLLEIVNPTLVRGTIKAFDIGKAEAVNQKFFCNFYYDGDASTFNNYVEFTFWGVPTSLFIHPGGACVGSPRHNDAAFCVSGTTHLYDTLRVDKDVAATYFTATGPVGAWNNGSVAFDFEATNNAARVLSKSTTTALASVQLAGASNTADNRFVAYLVCGEPSGPGSAQADFNCNVICESNFTAAHAHLRILPRSANLNTGSPNINADANNLVINPEATHTLLLNWDQGQGVTFGNGAAATAATMDKTGSLALNGGLSIKGNTNFIDGSARITFDGTTYIDSFGSAGPRGLIKIRQFAGGASAGIESLTFDGGGNANFIAALGAKNLGLAAGGQSCLIGMTDTVAGVDYKQWILEMFNGDRMRWRTVADNGASDFVFMQVIRSGVHVTNFNISADSFTVTGAKSFVCAHPLDDTKDLVHSCLEGPENGVYYRGEVTTQNGTAEVTLPDYFEGLTFAEDRSVQLTVLVDDAANPVFGGLVAAGRVRDGKFTVYSADPSITVAWEVKAVRRIGVDRLEVTRSKAEIIPPTPTQQESKHGQRKRVN